MLTEKQIEEVMRQVKNAGKSGRQLTREALEARHLEAEEFKEEPANLKLAKLKVEQGLPLSPKDRYTLGFATLHEEVENES